jgi:hypothetical protein
LRWIIFGKMQGTVLTGCGDKRGSGRTSSGIAGGGENCLFYDQCVSGQNHTLQKPYMGK